MPDANRTKKALGAAMKKLMSTRSFADITVADICDECGLNRKSLYYHFEDKYALVNWIFRAELIEPLSTCESTDFWEVLQKILQYLYDNRMFYYHALMVRGDNCFRDYFAKYLQPHILVVLQNHFINSTHFTVKEKEEAYAEFLADAYVYSIEKWIVHYPQLTPEKYIDLFKTSP